MEGLLQLMIAERLDTASAAGSLRVGFVPLSLSLSQQQTYRADSRDLYWIIACTESSSNYNLAGPICYE